MLFRQLVFRELCIMLSATEVKYEFKAFAIFWLLVLSFTVFLLLLVSLFKSSFTIFHVLEYMYLEYYLFQACVFVALGTLHEMHVHHIVTWGLSRFTIFFHII